MNANPSLSQTDEESERFEIVPCLSCGATANREFIFAEDDLTGKPDAVEAGDQAAFVGPGPAEDLHSCGWRDWWQQGAGCFG